MKTFKLRTLLLAVLCLAAFISISQWVSSWYLRESQVRRLRYGMPLEEARAIVGFPHSKTKWTCGQYWYFWTWDGGRDPDVFLGFDAEGRLIEIDHDYDTESNNEQGISNREVRE